MEDENNFTGVDKGIRKHSRLLRRIFLALLSAGLLFTVTSVPSCILRKKSPESYFYTGQKFMNQNDFVQAKRYFSKAIKKNRNYYEAYLHRAKAYEQLDSLNQAIADYTYVLDSAKLLFAQKGELLFIRGNMYYLSLNDSLMCKDYKRACELNHNKACDLIRKRCK